LDDARRKAGSLAITIYNNVRPASSPRKPSTAEARLRLSNLMHRNTTRSKMTMKEYEIQTRNSQLWNRQPSGADHYFENPWNSRFLYRSIRGAASAVLIKNRTTIGSSLPSAIMGK